MGLPHGPRIEVLGEAPVWRDLPDAAIMVRGGVEVALSIEQKVMGQPEPRVVHQHCHPANRGEDEDAVVPRFHEVDTARLVDHDAGTRVGAGR